METKYSRSRSVLSCDSSQNTYDGFNACTSIACLTAAVLLRSEEVPADIRVYQSIMRRGSALWIQWCKEQQGIDIELIKRNLFNTNLLQSWEEIRRFKPSLFRNLRHFNECNGFVNKQPTLYQKKCFLYKTIADIVDDLPHAQNFLNYADSARSHNEWCEMNSLDRKINIIEDVQSFRNRLNVGWNVYKGPVDHLHNYRTPGDINDLQTYSRNDLTKGISPPPKDAQWNPSNSTSKCRTTCVCTIGDSTFSLAHDTSGYYWFDSHAPEGVLKYYTEGDALIQDIITKYPRSSEFTSVFFTLDCVVN
jgi:hypothetical protein